MFQLVAQEILVPGIEQGIFRQMEVSSISRMIMTFYLGTASSVDKTEKPKLGSGEVTGFVLNAIKSNLKLGEQKEQFDMATWIKSLFNLI